MYAAVLAALPDVFVGDEARLAALVTWLAARMRDAFAAADMAVPPWRAADALLAKWRLHEGDVAVAPSAARAVPAPPPARGATQLVLMQRNGVPFTAHVAEASPARSAGA